MGGSPLAKEMIYATSLNERNQQRIAVRAYNFNLTGQRINTLGFF